ncbi:3-oxoacyl-[acyl-carrier-protein] synthase III C-terminal domain-containing protein [Catenuloplanes indicus]|uniref:3-oxoacyl-[acyl-carrier-protein] synthase-3 n=1 Tax=Catenuloplanes indicus TaxID=137267 RepID=A0AAE3VVW2_9ACTN|nr:3-oxoacyl-[acyl-carrier-protein] synthase III C-terminal domain-containing protein [Catenuloplanes indicus]MDQ0364988.1 3-oxoacyl-[acyl-carrier-protein] synthase-3 [Catenuloplanes indicus]
MPLTTLNRIATYVPERSVPVEEVAAELGMSRYAGRMFRKFHGLDRLRQDPQSTVLDLVVPPAADLLRQTPDPSAIRYLLFAHTIPDVAPSTLNVAEEVAARLGLTGVEAFAVTQQNCASGLAAIDIAGELLRADGVPGAQALVVTGEKAFTPVTRFIAETTIMGEGSAACLVGIDGPSNRVCSYVARTQGRFAHGIRLTPVQLRDFNDSYARDLTAVIIETVERAGLRLTDLDMVVPHNVNRLLWTRIIAELGLGQDRIFLDTIAEYSHCWCADPLLNLAALADGGRLIKGGRYLLTSVGLGSTYAAMVIEH